MSPGQLAQLFQPFNRLGRESAEPEGTGIGLAISQRLIEQMRGSIEVASEPEVGTEFRLVLNAARVDPQRSPTPAPIDTAAQAGAPRPSLASREDVGGRVLYIEDNPANSALVEQVLHFRPGITLYKAPDGATGLVLAAASRPDLILVDMRLPDMDGLGVLERLRQQPETLKVPCVALSANAMPADITCALQLGFAEYWTKPLDALQFLEGIDRYLGAPTHVPLAAERRA
jgi:CheY-like chemotaxis protein